jgi:hypothetical protein
MQETAPERVPVLSGDARPGPMALSAVRAALSAASCTSARSDTSASPAQANISCIMTRASQVRSAQLVMVRRCKLRQSFGTQNPRTVEVPDTCCRRAHSRASLVAAGAAPAHRSDCAPCRWLLVGLVAGGLLGLPPQAADRMPSNVSANLRLTPCAALRISTEANTRDAHLLQLTEQSDAGL